MEHKVLGFFCRHPGATQSDLASHAGRDKSQLARLIAGLRARGLLDAQPDPGRPPQPALHPTAAARAAQQAAQRQARVRGRHRGGRLSDAERSCSCWPCCSGCGPTWSARRERAAEPLAPVGGADDGLDRPALPQSSTA